MLCQIIIQTHGILLSPNIRFSCIYWEISQQYVQNSQKKTLTLKVTQIPTFYMFIVEAIKKWVWTNFIPRVVNVRKSFRTLTCMCVWRNLVFHATIEKIQNQTLNEHYTTTSSARESNWQRLVRRTRKHWFIWWVRWAPRRYLSLCILRFKLETPKVR